jgi:lipoprotein-anchoring transpeptidase ErfK/SrfK
MMRVSEHEISIATGRFWRIAVLTAAGTIGAASYAEAAVFWSDPDPALSRPGPSAPQRRQNSRRQVGKKIETQAKEAGKPQGPLVIAISIEKQHLKIYDANGLFAEAPVSTGMRGHSTPMGAFSVIQKQKLHHSNIYSGAPMPFMQRITWSGIAIHAGVLPGYPASHGCIRMPMAFAVKMYGWTKMGARVVITPGEITPASISHPLLAAQKVAPQPVAADESKTSVEKTNVEKASATPVMQEPTASTSLRDQTHTADAGSTLPAIKTPVTMSDATPETASAKAGDASSGDTKPEAVKAEAAKPDAESAAAKPEEVASSGDKPAATKSSEAAIAEIKPAETAASDGGAKKSEEPVEKPGDQVKSAPDTVPDAAKDQARLTDTLKPTVTPDPAFAAAPKRSGQIAVFISRKDAKIYVRQNFTPLYDAPVTIAPSDRPLGTHVFTAQVDKDDANVLHWSVVSLPAPPRNAERRDEDERATRRHKIAGAVEMKPTPEPDSATEALDRITIPTDVMARIAESLSTGGSIIVSDQGITAGETGEGTDFIVSLR